jgi:hypothetical protein
MALAALMALAIAMLVGYGAAAWLLAQAGR